MSLQQTADMQFSLYVVHSFWHCLSRATGAKRDHLSLEVRGMPLPHDNQPIDETIADDLLNGLEEIGRFIGQPAHRAKVLIRRRIIPATRWGKEYIGSRRHIAQSIDQKTRGFLADRNDAT